MRIADHHGTAGVIFTGDDGEANPTDLAFNNRLTDSVLLDNADGVEFTRGARDSALERNSIALTQPLPVEGNAVEFFRRQLAERRRHAVDAPGHRP